MTVDNLEKFHQQYLAGQEALEKSQYRLSIKYLEAAINLVSGNSRQGGEAQIWLVTAYQAANKIDQAISLCENLLAHPHLRTREQAQSILYIIKAPKLERPPEWMSEIPDLGNSDNSYSQYVTAKKTQKQKSADIELEDLKAPPTNSQDNQFIWFALILVTLILGSLVCFSLV